MNLFRRLFWGLFGSLVFISCTNETPLFVDVAGEASGVRFENTLDPNDTLDILSYLYYYNGAGVASADFNNDGFEDLYFVSNLSKDRLFLNLGEMKFEDVTDQAGVDNGSGWTFGVTCVDIDNNGWVDIYLSKVGKYRNIVGRNLLFLNMGLKDGKPFFVESAEKFGLDIQSFCTQTTFFDIDLDGDLDAYVLNHSVHPNSNYGNGSKRDKYDSLAGDMLLINENGFFVDYSSSMGIHQGKIGYGLDVSVGDLNDDGFPDVYVGNDFFENDYLYLNEAGDSLIDQVVADGHYLGHTTHFSMGSTIADFNNDGMQDVLSLDMRPNDLAALKISGTEFPYPTYQQYMRNGYAHQFMQNTLHLNRGSHLSEVGYQMGLSSTEWSWAALAEDFDQDGKRDVYITNGIPAATNDLDYVKFASQDAVQDQIVNSAESRPGILQKIPSKLVVNHAFRNLGSSFEDVSSKWFESLASYSSGAVATDLDNDGDVDIAVNNINQQAFLFENTLNRDSVNYLTVTYRGQGLNSEGLGAKTRIFIDGEVRASENYTNRSYLSSTSPKTHFGLGKAMLIDSIVVIWPGGAFEKRYDVAGNTTITFDQKDAAGNYYMIREPRTSALKVADRSIEFEHREQLSLDFDREPLATYAKSNEGPGIAVGDVNNDDIDDIFMGGAKFQTSVFMISDASGNYVPVPFDHPDVTIKEVTASLLVDVDNDGDLDLVVGYGGNEFVNGEALRPNIYINERNNWVLSNLLQDIEMHVSDIENMDIDNDGDADLIFTSNTVTGEFGLSGENVICINEGGQFKEMTHAFAPAFSKVGLVEDMVIIDFDQNGYEDIVVAGHWFPITVFLNDGSRLSPEVVIDNSSGWWNTVEVRDFDQDGDLDIIAGNWGLNTSLTASEDQPITLYRYDFDQNEKDDPIVSYYYQGQETTIASKDELTKQLPFLNKKYLSYSSFARASFSEVFGKERLKQAATKTVARLSSTYFENLQNNKFKMVGLPTEAQVSSVQALLSEDIDEDGYLDAILVGNSFEISTQLGRLDALHGLILRFNPNKNIFEVFEHLSLDGAARSIDRLQIKEKEYFLVGINNGRPVLLENSEK